MKHYATEGKIALNDDGVFVPVDLPGLPSLNELPTLVPREWDSPYAHFLHSEHELVGWTALLIWAHFVCHLV